MSAHAYAPDKILYHRNTLRVLREGGNSYPLHLHLIISDLCNLDCGGCAYRLSGYSSNELFSGPNGERNPVRFLSKELVRSVIDDCVTMGTKALELTGGGEPTVHPHCRELLEYAQERGLDTALITNGLRLPLVGDAAVRTQWLRISLDAASAATFAKVRPGFGLSSRENFDRVTRAIRWAVVRKRELGSDCTIGVGFVVQRDNWHEIYDAVELAYQLGADNVRISGLFTPEGDAYHTDFRERAEALERRAVTEFDGIGLGRSTFRVYGRYSEKLADLAGPPSDPRCGYQHVTTYLGGDGNLYRCCVTSYNKHGLLGNVLTAGGLRKLWDSPEVQEKLRNFDARSCVRCQFNDRNKAINAAIDAPELPPGPEIPPVHPFFV